MSPDGQNVVPGVAPLQELIGLVRPELERVKRELAADLRPDRSDLDGMVAHAAGYQGKLLRPALVCLSGKLFGSVGDRHIEVAKVVELLHTATLVHDDVLDDAEIRRRQETVNARWGNEVSVLLGDYLYARAFHMSVQLDDPTCSRVLGEVVRRICQGEITQMIHRFNFEWTEERYYQVITEKTALLYGASCRLGGHYSGATPEQTDALDRFGTELGVAFQIVDDVLDLEGEEDVVGKSLGTDLGKGKLTLPLLRLMSDPKDAERLRALMQSDADAGQKLATLERDFPLEEAIQASNDAARACIDRALDALGHVPTGPARDAMEAIARYVLARKL